MANLLCLRHSTAAFRRGDGHCRGLALSKSRFHVRESCCRRKQIFRAESSPPTSSKPAEDDQGEFVGLTPEEDYEIEGNYMDALSATTKLGKAVRGACEELHHLNKLEAEVMQECDDLLKKLGVKGSIFNLVPPAPSAEEESKNVNE